MFLQEIKVEKVIFFNGNSIPRKVFGITLLKFNQIIFICYGFTCICFTIFCSLDFSK